MCMLSLPLHISSPDGEAGAGVADPQVRGVPATLRVHRLASPRATAPSARGGSPPPAPLAVRSGLDLPSCPSTCFLHLSSSSHHTTTNVVPDGARMFAGGHPGGPQGLHDERTCGDSCRRCRGSSCPSRHNRVGWQNCRRVVHCPRHCASTTRGWGFLGASVQEASTAPQASSLKQRWGQWCEGC